jgi:type II restriction/modification system DNA methylase subunit YeeA
MRWWRHVEPRPALMAKLAQFERYIVTPRVSKYRLFVWCPLPVMPDSATFAFARDDDISFGILHSRFHEIWALRLGTSLEDRPRYTPTTTFETFPFPEGLTPNILASEYANDPRAQKIAAAAKRLDELRSKWLNPSDLVMSILEVVWDYPDRILPKNAAAAAVLKKCTLINLYNERPIWLDHAHLALDEAVAHAYGWKADMSDDEMLTKLLALNVARAEEGV